MRPIVDKFSESVARDMCLRTLGYPLELVTTRKEVSAIGGKNG